MTTPTTTPTASPIGKTVYFVDPRDYGMPQQLDPTRCAPFAVPVSEISRSIVEAPSDRDPGALYRLARIMHAVMQTYNLALGADPFTLQIHLANFDPDIRFFAIEGAAMGVLVREANDPDAPGWLRAFVARTRRDHVAAAYVGCGLGLAMIDRPHADVIGQFSELHRWFVLDGMGFMRALMDFDRFRRERERFPGMSREESRVADRGSGRAHWFALQADVDSIAETAHAFPSDRRPDIWQGIGLAAAFAGGVEPDALDHLRSRSGAHARDLAAGAIQACGVRFDFGAATPYTHRAAQALADRSPSECAALVRAAERSVGSATSLDAFEAWSAGILER
jgi:hypothetical protein